MSTFSYETSKSIRHHRGAPRIFLDGTHAARASFSPGDSFEVKIDEDRSITLFASEDGSRTVSGRRDRNGDRTIPVIDINSAELLAMFDGMDAVRMIVMDRKIVFLPLASEMAKKERLDRLANKIARGETLNTASLSHGFGLLANTLHQAFHDKGLDVTLKYANDIRSDILELARERNPSWSENTISLASAMQELIQDQWLMARLGRVEFMDLSLPCSGASAAGTSKLKLKQMEDHEHVGHLVFAALVLISKLQPAALVLENVTRYSTSASASIMRKQLRDMGYNLHEAVLKGRDFGCIENRERWCLVATTEGLTFSFDQISPAVTIVKTLGDIEDNIPLDDPRWKSTASKLKKQEQNVADGKGFKVQMVGRHDTSCGVLRKQYQKGGTTDPIYQHPDDPGKARLFTGDEHLRIMGIDEKPFEGLSESMKHQLAGQAVQPPMFTPVGARLAETMLSARSYAEYRSATRAQEALLASALGEGLSYEPVPTVENVLKTIQWDLFAEPDAGKKVEETADERPNQTHKRRPRLHGGGVG